MQHFAGILHSPQLPVAGGGSTHTTPLLHLQQPESGQSGHRQAGYRHLGAQQHFLPPGGTAD